MNADQHRRALELLDELRQILVQAAGSQKPPQPDPLDIRCRCGHAGRLDEREDLRATVGEIQIPAGHTQESLFRERHCTRCLLGCPDCIKDVQGRHQEGCGHICQELAPEGGEK